MKQSIPHKCCPTKMEFCTLHAESRNSFNSSSFHSQNQQSSSLHSNSLRSGTTSQGSFLSGSQISIRPSINHQTGDMHDSKMRSCSIHSGSVQSFKVPSSDLNYADSQSNNGQTFNISRQSSSQSSKFGDILLSQHDLVLQIFIKQNLKSRIFRGFYIERRYVDIIQGYRDIVALECNEIELEKVLIDIHARVVQFYLQQTKSIRWFGLSLGKLRSAPKQEGAMDAFIWTELKDVAYGQYWFCVKSVRFREDEIIFKLKVLRLVENKGREAILRPRLIPNAKSSEKLPPLPAGTKAIEPPETTVNVRNFVNLTKSWATTVKSSVYNFLSQDLSKENLVKLSRILGLLFFSMAAGGIYLIKNLGTFSLYFMYEISRLAHVVTPIIIKIIDVLSKAIGGFYIILTMVWKDLMIYLADRRELNLKLRSALPHTSSEHHEGITQKPRRPKRPILFSDKPKEDHYSGFRRKFPM